MIRIGQQAMERVLPIALIPLWGEYEGVEASVRLRWEESKLVLRFMVAAPELRRMTQQHNEAVWEDSCVEAFLQREGSDEYVNVECSASTRMLVAPASMAFSRSSFTTDAGRSTTSPAAIWLTVSGSRTCIFVPVILPSLLPVCEFLEAAEGV